MRERLALFASVSALVIAVALSPSARGQQETRRGSGDARSAAHMNETIHGIVAGITAEGEVYFNHQTNTAMKSEAAFLTVVGSPVHPDAAERENRGATTGNERRGGAAGHRHNVYIVWLTPKTKVCQATQSRESRSAEGATSDEGKKEVALDQLEVGDRVEIAFAHQEESAEHANIHQTEQMRGKHGRHRTHVGYATAITIQPAREHGQAGSGSGARSNERSK
jgi:hypothetical protein